MSKVLKLNPTPQMARLSLRISRLNGPTTLKFHWWVVIDVDNTMPIGFLRIPIFC